MQLRAKPPDLFRAGLSSTQRRRLTGMTTVAAMRAYVDRLCRDNEIDWHLTTRTAYAAGELREIHAPAIRGAVSYATVLHEIGHCLGRHQMSRRVLIREGWAWRWARSNAFLWTAPMERSARAAMAWYERHAARIGRRPRFPTIAEQMAVWARTEKR
jgi:hypothetical protein